MPLGSHPRATCGANAVPKPASKVPAIIDTVRRRRPRALPGRSPPPPPASPLSVCGRHPTNRQSRSREPSRPNSPRKSNNVPSLSKSTAPIVTPSRGHPPRTSCIRERVIECTSRITRPLYAMRVKWTEPVPKFGLHDSMGHHITRTARIVERRVEGGLRHHGLTRVGWCILLAVEEEGLKNPSEIAQLRRDRPHGDLARAATARG
jgi:hypothetical protein